jgi:hypothetical protein
MCDKKMIVACLMSILMMAHAYSIEVSGQVFGVWALDDSPYHIVADAVVPEGESLMIEPGVEVVFHGNYRLTVQGQIMAVGAESDSIRFVGGEDVVWHSIRLENVDFVSIFRYCVILGGTIGINPINSPLYVEYSRIGFMSQNGVSVHGLTVPAETVIRDSKLHDNGRAAIVVTQNSQVQILRNEITRSSLEFMQGAIMLSNQSLDGSCNPLIEGNWIHHNTWQGIAGMDITASGRVAPIVRNNLIERNHSGLNFANTGGRIYDNVIRDNFVVGNSNSGSGLTFNGTGVNTIVENNIITGNFTGFFIVGGAKPDLGSACREGNGSKGKNRIMNNIDETGTTHSVFLFNSGADVSAQNNYWGSDDADEIALSITDGAENPDLGIVLFEPFLTKASTDDDVMPATSNRLLGNYPNPFNPTTSIQFRVSCMADRSVIIDIYNVRGQRVRTLLDGSELLGAGEHSTIWDGRDDNGFQVGSGVYFYQMRVGKFNDVRRMVLIK